MNVDRIFLAICQLVYCCFAVIFGPGIYGILALFDQVKWRLRQVNVSLQHQLLHIAIEESQDQCGNVRTVHVGIGHDDDLVVTKLGEVKCLRVIRCANTYAQSRKHILDFLVFVDLVFLCFFYVEYFTP